MLSQPGLNLRNPQKAATYVSLNLRMIALSYLMIFSAILLLSMPSTGLAGVILVDDEKARQKEQQERQRNERSNRDSSDDNASRSSQSNIDKDEKGLKKKNTETNLIFGF